MMWRRDPRDSHTSGRHRAGLAPTVVHRRLWDCPARAHPVIRMTSAPGAVLDTLRPRRLESG